MAHPKIIDLANSFNSSRIFSVIQNKQGGKCHYCQLIIMNNETIVSSGIHRSYYHKAWIRGGALQYRHGTRTETQLLDGTVQLVQCAHVGSDICFNVDCNNVDVSYVFNNSSICNKETHDSPATQDNGPYTDSNIIDEDSHPDEYGYQMEPDSSTSSINPHDEDQFSLVGI